jgi:Peptidase U49
LTIASFLRSDAPGRYIEDRQRKYPPRYQRNAAGWGALFGGALDFAPAIIQTRAARGLIASGEVGELTPLACVTEVGRGYAVEMHSGLMRLIYSAARAMMATDWGKFRDHKTQALSGEQAAAKIAELFKNYKQRKIATAQAFPATGDQTGWADTITVYAEIFLLMHELAHVHNEYSFWLWRPFQKKRPTRELETAADAAASQWMIAYLLNPAPGKPQRQMFYAGAEFGLRVRMTMETVGMRFAATHPSAGDRVAALRASLRAAAGPRAFYAIANTSLAFDQMWRAIEKMLLEEPPEFELTLDDVLSSMRTLVSESAAVGYISGSIKTRDVPGKPGENWLVFEPTLPQQIELAKEARDYMARVKPDIFAAAYERAFAGDVYEPGTDEFYLLLAFLETRDP